jgi:hypothetical protein
MDVRRLAWQARSGYCRGTEHWSAISSNMMGMFRWQKDDAVRFYEFTAIEFDDPLFVLRIKYFYPGLKG